MKGRIFIPLLFLLFSLPSYCLGHNKKSKTKSNTSYINSRNISHTPDTTIENRKDTTEYISEEDWNAIYGNNVHKSETFYDSIKSIAYKRKITKILYNLTFMGGSSSQVVKDTILKQEDSPYNKYKGKVIANIEIIRLEPFPQDTNGDFSSFLERTGNSLHTLTKASVIKHNLLIKKGDKVNPLLIADNARMLRNLAFIDEANIDILPTRGSNDSVNIIVVTKDKFPIAFSPVIKGIDDFSLKLWTVNFMGYGHRFENKVSYDGARKPQLKYDEGEYQIPNIGGSFINGLVNYTYTSDFYRTILLRFTRPMILPKIIQSYGFSFSHVSYPEQVATSDTTLKDINIKYYTTDLYYAKGFPLRPELSSNKHPTYLVLSVRNINLNYIDTPFISPDSNVSFRSRLGIYGAVSLTRNNYFLANYVFSFGRTEDIPYGHFIQITGGYEFGTFYNRQYIGMQAGKGDYMKLGYYTVSMQIGSYIKEGSLDQGVLTLFAGLATGLYHIKRARVRNYLKLDYTYGINRLRGESIVMNSNQGLEGLGNNNLIGQQRIVGVLESVIFTPWFLYGFSSSIYSFVNIGALTPGSKSLFKGRFYTGFGLGIRLRNQNLVFNTLQLQIAYYPGPPVGAKEWNFSSSGIPEFIPGSYFVTIPTIYPFN